MRGVTTPLPLDVTEPRLGLLGPHWEHVAETGLTRAGVQRNTNRAAEEGPLEPCTAG